MSQVLDLSSARVVITGGHGFLGWHVACRLRALHGNVPVRLGHLEFGDPGKLREATARADVVIHLAGVNRANTEAEVETANEQIGISLAGAVADVNRPITVVYGNSIQALSDNSYGRGKANAGALIHQAVNRVGGAFVDVLLPNIFGEHGRPHYNSFVATFCHKLALGQEPEVLVDREVSLLHAQAAADTLLTAACAAGTTRMEPQGTSLGVSDVLGSLREFSSVYSRGEIPSLEDDFSVDLFNTYRSHTFPDQFPMHPQHHSDSRGVLVETVRSHGGQGMSFVSTTRPGKLRGNHYHIRKVERFFVVSGEAEIALRRLYHDEVVTFSISGKNAGFVDMPTMWVHSIRNVGTTDLVTQFWSDQLLDHDNPDQYAEDVQLEGGPL